MKYFKHKDSGEVFAFAADGSDDACIGAELEPMIAAEVELHLNPAPPPPTLKHLHAKIDTAADAARRAVAGDPLRAVEYANAATEAQAFAAASYQGAVPPMVAAWAINGRTSRQATDDILREAAQYNAALVQLRAVRLNAKELIRTAIADGQVDQAQDIAAETIAAIESAIAGIGNNA